jgi:hypothetical protein
MHERELVVRDISRRGIFLYTKESLGASGTTVTLKLALTPGIKPLTLRAEVVRSVREEPIKQDSKLLGVGLRFLTIGPEQDAQLLELLDRAMLGRGTNMRAYPRVYHLIEVICRTKFQARALMRDIGEGGVGLTIDQELATNEEVTLELSTDKEPLRLQGWAVSCEKLGDKPGLFRVGLRFGRIPPNVRRALLDYLKGLYRA